MLEGGGSELRVLHASISRHTAAWDARLYHLMSTEGGNLPKRVLNPHLFGGAGDVDGHYISDLFELELIEEEGADELHGLVGGELEARIGGEGRLGLST